MAPTPGTRSAMNIIVIVIVMTFTRVSIIHEARRGRPSRAVPPPPHRSRSRDASRRSGVFPCSLPSGGLVMFLFATRRTNEYASPLYPPPDPEGRSSRETLAVHAHAPAAAVCSCELFRHASRRAPTTSSSITTADDRSSCARARFATVATAFFFSLSSS